jgi:hypothetical protein
VDGADGTAERFARVAVDARRDVNGDDGFARSVYLVNDGLFRSADRLGQTRAENGIDDNV